MKRLCVSWIIFPFVAGLETYILAKMGVRPPFSMGFILGVVSYLAVFGLVSIFIKD